MGEVIIKAIPASEAAQEYLKERRGNKSFDIEATEAKELLNNNIVSHQSDFICATEGCKAPITCCSYKKSNKKAPYFRNHYEKENKHSENCSHHPENYEYENRSPDEKKKKYTDIKSNKVKSDFSSKTGFEPIRTSVKNKSDENSDSNGNNTEVKTRSSKTSNQQKYRQVSEHRATLKYHVEKFESEPDMLIVSKDTNKVIPIRYLFRSIERNTLFDINSEELSYIYYGKAWITEQSDTTYRINFINDVDIHDEKMKPSLFVKIKDVESINEEVVDAIKKVSSLKCTVYITYKLYIHTSYDKEYLNFAEFKTGERLTENTKNLKHNIYFKINEENV